MSDERLAGRTILVTRAAAQAGETVAMIGERGGKALLLPMIEIVPPLSWAGCDAAMERLSTFDGILFASANGVEGFFHRLSARGVDAASLATNALYAVGSRTKEAIERHGLAVRPIPERFTAADLLAAMGDAEVAGKTYLIPRGNLGSALLAEGLTARGARVETVEVYRTVEPDKSGLADVLAHLREGHVDAALFASPSAARHFAELFTDEAERARVRGRLVVAAIGPATASALASLGLGPDVTAPQSTMASLLDAVTEFLTRPSTTTRTP